MGLRMGNHQVDIANAFPGIKAMDRQREIQEESVHHRLHYLYLPIPYQKDVWLLTSIATHHLRTFHITNGELQKHSHRRRKRRDRDPRAR